MNNESANPYRAPLSNVRERPAGELQQIEVFKRFSAWGVFGLTVITFGIYIYYWVYTRTSAANRVHIDKIPFYWMHISILAGVAAQILGAFPDDQTFLLLSALVSVVSTVFYLTALFKLKNRTQDVLSGEGSFPLSGIMTFFFSAIYLQYKINERIDIFASVEPS